MPTRIQLRRDAADVWGSKNPILADGELGVVRIDETDVVIILGDGVTPATELPPIAGTIFTTLPPPEGPGSPPPTGGGTPDTLITNGAVSGYYSVNPTTATVHDITLIDDTQIALPLTGSGVKYVTVIIRQDEAGGRLISWGSSTTWSGSSPPDLSVNPNSKSIVTFMTVDGGYEWFGFVSGEDMGNLGVG